MSSLSVVSRVLLGLCALASVVGGGALVVMVIVYFGASEYVHQLQVGGYGTLVGALGLGLYVGGVFRAHVLARVGVGVFTPIAAYGVTGVVAMIVSLAADPGGPRGNLEDGTIGAQWLVVGCFLGWQALTGRWPRLAPAPSPHPTPHERAQ